jgi:RES domain-containing protein
MHGGRWNPRGTPALYMSATLDTAVAEYQQELGYRPGTFVAYDIDIPGIVDLSDPASQAALEIAPEALLQPWKHTLLVEGREPAGWAVARRLIEEGFYGALVPSAAAAGTNMVLWQWTLSTTTVRVLDPQADLPPAT